MKQRDMVLIGLPLGDDVAWARFIESRIDAWDAQIARMKKQNSKLNSEPPKQSSMDFGPITSWLSTYWPK